jgi:hypothetical protein
MCAILCPRHALPEKRGGRRWAGRHTSNDGHRRVSTSVLFKCGMLVNAVHRNTPGVLSTRSQINVGRQCSDCVYLEVLACLICSVCACHRLVRSCFRPGGDVVEQTDFLEWDVGVQSAGCIRVRGTRCKMSHMRSRMVGLWVWSKCSMHRCTLGGDDDISNCQTKPPNNTIQSPHWQVG